MLFRSCAGRGAPAGLAPPAGGFRPSGRRAPGGGGRGPHPDGVERCGDAALTAVGPDDRGVVGLRGAFSSIGRVDALSRDPDAALLLAAQGLHCLYCHHYFCYGLLPGALRQRAGH